MVRKGLCGLKEEKETALQEQVRVGASIGLGIAQAGDCAGMFKELKGSWRGVEGDELREVGGGPIV